jgi:hypothetical protein
MMRIWIGLFCCVYFFSKAEAQIKEPYKPLHGGNYSGPAVPASPDPLIRYQWKNPKVADSLQLYFLQPKKITGIPVQSFVQNNNAITVTGKGDLLFDFGTESAGWIEFESDDLADSVEMSISEYNEPAVVNAGAQNAVKTKRPVKQGNTYRLQLNDGLYEGVRFGWIHVKQFSKPWHIKNVQLACQVKPVNYKGSFYTNDTMLNRIWYTGAYVVKLNMLQDYFGAILMERSDRHSWTGDAYPAQAAALAAFGNYDVIKKNIAFTSVQDNGIAAYSIYWVLSLIDYYNYTGDTNFLKAYAANADSRLEKAFRTYDTLPNLGFMGWDERLGAGFENTQIREAQNTYRMLCINGWRQFAKAMLSINKISLAKKYQQFAEEKIRQILADKKVAGQFGLHAVAEAINAGLYDQPMIHPLAESLFADRLNRLSYSPFNQYFIVQAMALAHQHVVALTTIRDCWGGQIAYGGSSFFEVYRPSWNAILNTNDAPPNNQCGYTSLAHPWGAGVTKWLTENVLGIQPVTAGFKTFTIIPFLKDSLTRVKGTMPTPLGDIAGSFNIQSGECYITIPAGAVAAKIGLPKGGRQIDKIVFSKRLPGKQELYQKAIFNNAGEDSNYVYVKNVKAGRYKITISYKDIITAPVQLPEPFNYPIHAFTHDSTTGGHWSTVFGKDGYIFLGYPDTVASKKLPSYVDSVTIKKNGIVIWDTISPDKRVLENPDAKKQWAAAIITKDPEATNQTMTIDVAVKGNHSYRLSLYFLDWDKKDRRSAIEIFDAETLNIIAPVQLIQHYENGRYISFGFDKSVRIRVNQVRGQNAAVSGLFFDDAE